MALSHISRFVFWGSVGFICGVGILSFFAVSIDTVFFIVSIIAIGSIVIFFRQSWVWCFVFAFIMIAVGSFVMNNILINIHLLENNVNNTKNDVARVCDVTQKGWATQVKLQYKDGVIVIIKDKKYTDLVQGDIINLECHTVLPEVYNNFDYHKYLVMKGIDYVCDNFSYEIIRHEPTILNKIAQFRLQMESVVDNIIPAPEAGLANGLLFGGSDKLSKDLQDKFAKTGMTHIVAVSGYNVSIIIIVVMGFIIFLGASRKWAVLFSIVGIIFFVALIGFPSSGVRAAIMGVLVLVAAVYGRISNAYSAIFFTGAIMLVFNPLLLRYDIGFQLSFLATLGIVSVYPVLEKFSNGSNKALGLVEILLLTISAQLFVVPIILYHFKIFSFISLLANVLILLIIPPTMLFVFIMIVANFVFHPLALFFGWLAYFLLAYEIHVIEILSRISWGTITIDHINGLWFGLYYIVVGICIFLLNKYLYEI